MIELKCPSCNGSLELPENMEIAHCLYCGTKILLNQNRVGNNINQYCELLKTAIEVEDFDEAIQYCNKILEIDSKNIDAWIDKALASFKQTTASDNKFGDAIIYLKKAYEISPEYNRIVDVTKLIVAEYALFENRMGCNDLENAVKLKASLEEVSSEQSEGILGWALLAAEIALKNQGAKQKSLPLFQSAVSHLLTAARYAPSDITILNNIFLCTQKADWYDWNQLEWAGTIIAMKDRLEKKIEAENGLDPLKKKIIELENSLKKVNSSNNLFKKSKMKEIETEIDNAKEWIAYYEQIALFQPPEFDINKLLLDHEELSNTQPRKVARPL